MPHSPGNKASFLGYFNHHSPLIITKLRPKASFLGRGKKTMAPLGGKGLLGGGLKYFYFHPYLGK